MNERLIVLQPKAGLRQYLQCNTILKLMTKIATF